MAQRSLARAASELFAYVQLFQSGPPGEKPALEPLRAHLLRELAALAETAEAQALPPAELDAARFALVAWTDEMVLRTSWLGRDAWAREPLQLKLYGTNRGGDQFYDKLVALDPRASAARGVFLLCLCFGFEGGLAGREPERRRLILDQYEMLRVAGAVVDPGSVQPVVGPAPEDLAIELPPSERPLRLYLVAMGVVLVSVYALLWITLYSWAGNVPEPWKS